MEQEVVAARREVLGDRHPHTLTSISNLAALLYQKGELGQAEELYREALKAQR